MAPNVNISYKSFLNRPAILFLWALIVITGCALCGFPRLRALVFPEYVTGVWVGFGATIYLWKAINRAEQLSSFEKPARSQDVDDLLRFLGLAVVMGFYLLIRLGWSQPSQRYQLLFGILLWGTAMLMLGALLGFLFGIPRTLSGSSADRQAEARTTEGGGGTESYRVNTNLERVSDWLTQIIVGGTVTQLALFPSYLNKIADFYVSTTGIPTTAGWRLAGIGNTLYFFIVGFLGCYLVTRLYLAGAIERADGSATPQVAKLSNLTAVEMEALEAAQLSYGDQNINLDPIADQAAKKILTISLEDLSHWRDLRVWAKAQLSSGRAKESILAYVRVIELVPDDAETRLGYAIALGAEGNAGRLVLAQIERARAAIMMNTPENLRKNIYKSLSYAVLFLKPPESFLKALAFSREYARYADSTICGKKPVESVGILFNAACASGQANRWLKQDISRELSKEELVYK